MRLQFPTGLLCQRALLSCRYPRKISEEVSWRLRNRADTEVAHVLGQGVGSIMAQSNGMFTWTREIKKSKRLTAFVSYTVRLLRSKSVTGWRFPTGERRNV